MRSEQYVGTRATCVLTLLSTVIAIALALLTRQYALYSAARWLTVSGVICAIVALIGGIHCFRYTYNTWIAVAERMNKIATIVLFGAIYLVIVPPFAVIARLLDPLRLRARNESSYWINRKQAEVSAETLQRMS